MAQRDGISPVSASNESSVTHARPKRYSPANISKKFLEKNSHNTPISASNSPSVNISPASAPKAIPRAPSQTPGNHSKLVTAKLTAPSPSVSSQGWSRPASAAPPASPPPNISPAQKLIHPQPRPTLPLKDGPAKPAWANLKPVSPNGFPTPSADFPTAAEVAHGVPDRRSAKPDALLPTPQALESNKQREMEAATFRGAHLDPNAHHWDDMEEDDDNFLDGDLDFGDGKQYKIESAGLPHIGAQFGGASSNAPLDSEPIFSAPEPPVRKEDRFADDFDRSWPRTKPPSSTASQEASTHPSPPSSHHGASPQESSRVLFNERSNKLEPYTNSRPPLRKGTLDSLSPVEGRSPPVHLLNKASHESWTRPSPFPDKQRDRESQRDGHAPRESLQDPRNRRSSHVHPPLPLREHSFRSGSDHHPPVPSAPFIEPRQHGLESPIPATAALHPGTENQTFQGDLEEARKDVMHTAAERARQRRQQEEEDREREKERARKKAAELESKMKSPVAGPAQSPQMIVSPQLPKVEPAPISQAQTHVEPIKESQPSRPPVHSRPSFGRNDSRSVHVSTDAPADKSTSWRTKVSPVVTVSPAHPQPMSAVPAFEPPPPSALDHVAAIADSSELEVVDFSDFGAFLGITSPPPPPEPEPQDLLPSPPITNAHLPRAEKGHEQTPSSSPPVANPPITEVGPWRRKALASEDGAFSPPSGHHLATAPRNHKSQLYKEATMTSLDDTMSRIKGALDGMHELQHQLQKEPKVETPSPIPGGLPTTSSQTQEQPAMQPPLRWVSSFHSQNIIAEAKESPATIEPLLSPKSAWEVYRVRLPKERKVIDPIPSRQLHLATRPPLPLRWDILCFDPPVEGMSKKTLSINDVLFRQHGQKIKPRFRVLLPKSPSEASALTRAKIHGSRPANGAFGRAPAADEATSWRKPKVDFDDTGSGVELSTTSRSPPPELPSVDPKIQGSMLSVDSRSGARKQPPKIPAGVGVGFYKSPLDGEPGSVNFIVSSELDEPVSTSHELSPKPPTSVIGGHLQSDIGRSSVSRVFPPSSLPNGTKLSPAGGEYSLTRGPGSKDSKSSQDSNERLPLTPPSANTPWKPALGLPIKDSSSGIPDPELLKAVWSQASDKPEVASVNSLEGIADDLSSVPFTIQDVKSEDGETPPPTAPPRISLHEVTRAFQQVPSSSSTSTARPPVSAPSTANATSPAAAPPRPNMYTSSPTASHTVNGARPVYIPFGPNAPAPANAPPSAHVYSGPAGPPPRVMGNGPMYSQPVWMPMGGANPPNPAVLRPMAAPFTPGSPYASPMMPYSGPGTPPMYHAHAGQMPPAPIPNGAQNRPPGMPMMNPVAPMYPASPVMMQAAPVMHAGAPPFVPGRPAPQRVDQAPGPPQFVPQGYPPMASPQYARPGW